MRPLGTQTLADLYGCDAALLDDPQIIERLLIEAAERCGATVVGRCVHHFNPYGVSGVLVIAESHLAVHTWPEHRYAAFDLFTCGDSLRPEECFQYLKEALRSQHHTLRVIHRGSDGPLPPPDEAEPEPEPAT